MEGKKTESNIESQISLKNKPSEGSIEQEKLIEFQPKPLVFEESKEKIESPLK